jgi:hypothetical protein
LKIKISGGLATPDPKPEGMKPRGMEAKTPSPSGTIKVAKPRKGFGE